MLKSCVLAAVAVLGLALSTPSSADARVGVYVGPNGGVAVRAGRPYYGGAYGYAYPSYGYSTYASYTTYSYPSYSYAYPSYGYGYAAPYYGRGRGVVVGPNGGGAVYGPRGSVGWR